MNFSIQSSILLRALFLLLMSVSLSTHLLAQKRGSLGVTINVGYYYNITRSADTRSDPYLKDNFTINEGIPITIELFRRSFFEPWQKSRFGLRFTHLSVKALSQQVSSSPINFGRTGRHYRMNAFWGIFQGRIYDTTNNRVRLQMAFDLAAGFSLVDSKIIPSFLNNWRLLVTKSTESLMWLNYK